jgi:sensor domain CHASE-containing protein
MKLRSKTLVFSGIILITLVVVILSLSQLIFLDTYSGIETKYSYHVINDQMSQFNQSISSMNQTAKDWAQWDDAYTFVSGKNPSFIRNNLPSKIFIV